MNRMLFNGKMMVIFALILALFMAVGVAEEEITDASGQWKYLLEDGGATITGYVEEPTGDLEIPSELDGYPVTGIGDGAFFWCVDLDGVSIPDSVTSIGVSAFELCSGLTSVTIPDSVTSIGDSAFYACEGLTGVTIPGGVKSIGNNAFAYCEKLAGVAIPASVTSIDEGVFYECGELVLSVTEGSYAEQYAKAYNIPYNNMENLARENGIPNMSSIPAFDTEGRVVHFSETEKNNLAQLFSAANPSDLLVSFDFGDNINHAMWVAGFAACYRGDETSSDFNLFSEDAETHFADLWGEYFDGWDPLEDAIPPEDILPYSINGTVRDSIYYRAKNETMQSLIKGIYGREMVDPEESIRYYNGYFYFGHIGDYEDRLWYGYDYTVDTVYDLLNRYYRIEGIAALYGYADGELEDTKAYEALVKKDDLAKYTFFLIAQRFSE